MTHVETPMYLFVVCDLERAVAEWPWPGSQEVGGSIPAVTKIVSCKNLAFNIGECVSSGSDTT